MKKNYLSLLLAGILFISGCETISGSSTSSDSPSYEYGDSNKLIFKLTFKMKLVIEYILKQINIIYLQLQLMY